MSEAFEEIAAREIDGLYQEALFLSGGSEEEAEKLLSRTIAHGFRAFKRADRDGDGARRWLEGRLVVEFLRDAGGGEALQRAREKGPERAEVSGSPPDPDALDPTALYEAAERIPAGPRAVLWLVLFGRWSYGEVEELLDVDRGTVRDLVRYRHVLLAEILRDGWGRASPRSNAVN